ncbi:MAG: protein-disulfide reductase DsbD [Marinobacter sp.]|uniref:protein-disulfide reductase DsbD n=1 Tax=Marinobacter sp. TaxID=50741 RepID=UPI00329851B4
MTGSSTTLCSNSLPRVLSRLILFLALSFLSTLTAGAGNSLFGNGNDFLPVDEALPFSFTAENGAVVLSWNIAPDHYLYEGRISVSSNTEGVELGEPEFSYTGTDTEDEFFGKVTVFYEPVEARVPVKVPEGIREAQLQVTYQGCASAGLCYPPQTRDVLYYASAEADSLSVSASGPGSATSLGNSLPGPENTSTATGLAGFLANQSTLVIAGLFLLLGLGLTFTPCVLPMVPIISSLVSSRNTSTTAHALLLSTSYVLGMALTYAAAGVITGLLGASFNLQAHLQSPWVLGVFATLFVIFALSMFNLFEIQLPRFIREPLDNASHRLTGTRVASIFGIGALSALIVSPCVSAPLAGSLLYISTTQDAVIGGVALFSLGLGMGLPLILVAVGGRKLLPTTGHWMNVVKAFYGVMLLAVAIWLIERIVPGWAALTLWGLLVAITGVQLGAFDAAKAGWERTRKGMGLVLFAYGIALLAGAVSGASDPLRPLAAFTASSQPLAGTSSAAAVTHAEFIRLDSPADIRNELQQASRTGTPVMLDFYADWCISCKVMERNVFSDRNVIQALAPYKLLQLDMTDNTPEQQALLDELGLFGPPAILFFNNSGAEMEAARVLGEMDRDQFLGHLDALGTSSRPGQG